MRSNTDKAQAFRFYWQLAQAGQDAPEPTEEYNFDKELGRLHRFDFAFPAYKIAVEVEGNAWNVRGGGRHMRDSDLEKYNIAASLGWRVFRFSPGMLEKQPVECIEMVLDALKERAVRVYSDDEVNEVAVGEWKTKG